MTKHKLRRKAGRDAGTHLWFLTQLKTLFAQGRHADAETYIRRFLLPSRHALDFVHGSLHFEWDRVRDLAGFVYKTG